MTGEAVGPQGRSVGAAAGEGHTAATANPIRPGFPAGKLGEQYRAQKFDFLGIGLSCLPDDDFLAAVHEAVATQSRLTISFINPDYVLRAHRTADLMGKINRFDIVLPDGWGVVLGGRWLGLPVPDRQGNDDICPKLFSRSEEYGLSNFLFGCGEGVPERAAANLVAMFPGLRIAGTLHGYWDVVRGHPGSYDKDDIDMMVQAINQAQCDVLHVSLPTPMQQDWVWQVADRLTAPVIITGGTLPRSPRRTRLLVSQMGQRDAAWLGVPPES